MQSVPLSVCSSLAPEMKGEFMLKSGLLLADGGEQSAERDLLLNDD